jgi:hypothetical protein
MKLTRITFASLFVAVGGIAVACSSSTTQVTSDGGTGPVDSGPKKEASVTPMGDGGSSGTTCPVAVKSSDIMAFKSPSANMLGACSDTDLSNLKTKFNDAMATFMDLYTAVGASCQKCVFSNSTDSNWQEIVWLPDMATGMGNAMINFGACYVSVPGGSAACGKGVEDDQQCLTTACPSPDCDGTDMGQSCIGSAAMGDCMMYETEYTTGCGSAAKTLDATCGDALIAINFMCGNGSLDGGTGGGGTDGGTDAADQ